MLFHPLFPPRTPTASLTRCSTAATSIPTFFSLLCAAKLDDVLDFLGDDRPNVNHPIYAVFERVAKQFLAREVKRSAARFSCTEYTIFTNYLNSHLWFVDTELQRWFEN